MENVDTERLADLVGEVRARRGEIEELRRLPDDVAAKLRASGIFARSVPRAIGGTEEAPLETMLLIETLAAGDGSTGWCAMIGLGNNVAAGYMPEADAREVFADPTRPVAGIAAPCGGAVRVFDRLHSRRPLGSRPPARPATRGALLGTDHSRCRAARARRTRSVGRGVASCGGDIALATSSQQHAVVRLDRASHRHVARRTDAHRV